MDKIAFLDIDDTLVKGQTQKYLAVSAFRAGLLSFGKLIDLLVFFAKYKLGKIEDVSQAMLGSYSLLKGMENKKFEHLIDGCFVKSIKPRIYPEAEKLVAELKASGYKIFLISNTVQPIVDRLAGYLAADGGIGTELEQTNGRLTGRISRLAYGQNKVDCIKQQFGGKINPAACAAYSDSSSDVPLLEFVGRPATVNPDKILKIKAEQNNWPIIYFK